MSLSVSLLWHLSRMLNSWAEQRHKILDNLIKIFNWCSIKHHNHHHQRCRCRCRHISNDRAIDKVFPWLQVFVLFKYEENGTKRSENGKYRFFSGRRETLKIFMDMLSESLQQLQSFQKIYKTFFFLFPTLFHIHCLPDNFHFQCCYIDWRLAWIDSLWVIGKFCWVESFPHQNLLKNQKINSIISQKTFRSETNF